MRKGSGGPAFPEVVTEGNKMTLLHGMSRREWLAAKFAAAWVPCLVARSRSAGYTDEAAACEANRLGYLQADAMLGGNDK